MTLQELQGRLTSRFGQAVSPPADTKTDPFCVVSADRIVEVCRFAKEEPGVEMDFLEDLTALDWPKRNVIEVVYHLFSLRHRHGIVLKVEADRSSPHVPSVEGVWKTANWFEREVFDLFGVAFAGHPDMRRILMPDDWVGHPLRKDYQEAGGYHGIENTRENPLVELRRLDLKARAAAPARPEASASAAPPSRPGQVEAKGAPAPAPARAPSSTTEKA
jgi:NADH-quinone oxidoreductase subunit C